MLSVSMLSGYLYCPRKVYLQYVLKIFEPPKPAIVLGSIRHKVFEELNRAEESIVSNIKEKIGFDELLLTYKARYLRIARDIITKSRKDLEKFDISLSEAFANMSGSVIEEAEQRARNVSDFIEKNNVFGDELWEKLTPKIVSEFSIASEKVGLRGIVDRIEMYDDFMIPIELKTGKSPAEGAWPSHKLQLSAYILMLSEKQRKVREGRLIYLDSNRSVSIANNPFVEEEVMAMIEKTKAILNSEKPPSFSKNSNKCDACGLKKQCFNEEFIRNRIKQVFEGSKQKQKIYI